jgi:hypothetical protein
MYVYILWENSEVFFYVKHVVHTVTNVHEDVKSWQEILTVKNSHAASFLIMILSFIRFYFTALYQLFELCSVESASLWFADY